MAKRQRTTTTVSRREVLAWSFGAAAAYGSVRWSSALAAPDELPHPPLASGRAYLYLTAAEAAFIDAAIARLIPADETGPGAIEAEVTAFIDSQLAGPYGRAVDWYMQGPFEHGTRQQGYQSELTPAQLYRAAIAAIDERAHEQGGKSFAQLSEAQCDQWLHELEDDKVDLGEVPAKTFFTLLWQNTQEGYFADPIYGGNRGFAGWHVIGYPGPRYNYLGAIDRYGQRYALPTVGLLGREGTR